MKIAGRCDCGILASVAEKDRRAHRRCNLPETGDGKVCAGPCRKFRRLAFFYLDRTNDRHQSLCRYCGGASARVSYATRYRTDAEFRESERARRRRPDAIRKSAPFSPSSRVAA